MKKKFKLSNKEYVIGFLACVEELNNTFTRYATVNTSNLNYIFTQVSTSKCVITYNFILNDKYVESIVFNTLFKEERMFYRNFKEGKVRLIKPKKALKIAQRWLKRLSKLEKFK